MVAKLQFGFDIQQSILRKISAIDAFQSRWKIEQADEQAFLKQMNRLKFTGFLSQKNTLIT